MEIHNKIFVVDDDATIQKTLKMQLTSIGYEISGIVSSGKEAINTIGLENHDLILMDIKLKGELDGIETAKKISKKVDIPIVFLTAHSDDDLVAKAKETSPYGYLVKPVTKRDLNIALKMAIYKHNIDKKLKISEARYRAIVEDQTELICRYSKDNKITFVNGAFCNYYNIKCNNISNLDIFAFIPPEKKEIVKDNISKLKFRNPVTSIEYKIILPNKKECWLQRMDRAIFDDQNNIIEYQCVCFDITDRKKAEEELIAEKERLAVTLKSISDGVVATNINAEIILINQIAEDLTGWDQKEAIGKKLINVFKILDQKSRKECKNPVEEVLNSKKTFELNENIILIDKSGNEKIISESAAPIRNDKNEIIGAVLVFRDITEKQKMEEEFEKANKLESLGILAGGIAHDFNNIITGILGNISLAMIDLDTDDNNYILLSEAEKAVKKARELAGQLLTFAKGGTPIKKTATIVDIVRDSASFVLRGSNVHCEFDVDDNIPAVEVDVGQINQVINNLIMNADQAMPEGGSIIVGIKKVVLNDNKAIPLNDGLYIKITIKDEGIGIQQKHLQKIFDPYFTTKQKGNGLGLAICYSIIKKHDGHIMVESELGKGAIFSVFLPASKIKKTVKNELAKKLLYGEGNILVMDDEAIVRKVIGKMISRLGYHAEFACDGEESIKIYKKHYKKGNKFDVVVMDLTVPGKMGGKRAVQGILQIDRNAKVIVSSGYSNDPIMSDYKKFGFINYITKPYKIEDLSEVLYKVVNNK